jgi:hypothetical protein
MDFLNKIEGGIATELTVNNKEENSLHFCLYFVQELCFST